MKTCNTCAINGTESSKIHCYKCLSSNKGLYVPAGGAKTAEAPRAAENTLKVMLDDGAILPTRAHPADAGLDLYSRECMKIYPGEAYDFDTGVHVAIPAGYVGMIKSKSGLNVNHGLTSEGVIDSGYTGSIVVNLFNHGKHSYLVEKGQKISQLVILPIITPDLELVDSLEETARGNGGFGSTGAF